jgi:peptidoglycan hydrolase-like protein with peptidoglycan-binding domain
MPVLTPNNTPDDTPDSTLRSNGRAELPVTTGSISTDVAARPDTPPDAEIATPPPPPSVGSPTPTAGKRRRGRWLKIGVPVALVVAAAGASAAVLLSDDTDTAESADEPASLRAVTAETRDLVEFTDLEGSLSYADSVPLSAGTTGVVTAVVTDGDIVSRGDVAVEVNGEPVVALYGDVPLYRLLSEGTEGDDVLLLEQNRASLGYHATEDDDGEIVDGDFTVDGVFDAATTDAVERWQSDLGLEETGSVAPGDVVVVDGPSIASGITIDVGSRVQEGVTLMDLQITGAESGFYGDHAGDVDLLVTSGPIENGVVLYTADDLPVTAVVVDPNSDVVVDRTLSDGVDNGDDVLALEEMLVALGYDADGDLDVDDEFDSDTIEAIEEWQDDLQDNWEEVDVDGVVEPEDLIVVPAGTVVETVTFTESETTARGTELFVATSNDASRVVTTSIAVSEQDTLIEGQEVTVEFPDGSTATGLVNEVATASTLDPTNPNAEAELAVEIILPSVPESVVGFTELDVEIKLVDEISAGATVVPVTALVATGDGYAVEVVSGSTTQFVAVEPGMFADGFVEVSGIDVGTAVVVP